ncbi:hypothetical protein [Gorillibacterium sp. sgz500922]|uniref:hypothetical protein n=1 Tax=Gorillibacterium sp. sgz500922 TaxID=3446694 RepID=UPI003F673D75
MGCVLSTALALVPLQTVFADDASESLSIESTPNSMVTPYATQCVEGWAYRNVTPNYINSFVLGSSGTRYWNSRRSGGVVTMTSTITDSKTLSGSIEASGKFNIMVVETTVKLSSTLSKTWTSSDSTTVPVNPGYEGWNDYGTNFSSYSGYSVYVNADCTEQYGTTVTIKGKTYDEIIAREAWRGYLN